MFWSCMPNSAEARSKNNLPYLREERSHLLSERQTLVCRRRWMSSLVTGRGSWVTAATAEQQRPGSHEHIVEPQVMLGEEEAWILLQPRILLLHTACRKAAGEGVAAGLLQAPRVKQPWRRGRSIAVWGFSVLPRRWRLGTTLPCVYASKSLFPRFEETCSL